jgi:hypothetical protein
MRGATDTHLIRPEYVIGVVPVAARLMPGFPFDLAVQVRRGVHRLQLFLGNRLFKANWFMRGKSARKQR